MASTTVTVTPLPGLSVYLVVTLNSRHLIDAVILPALQPQAFPRVQAANSAGEQHTGGFPFMIADTTVLLGGQAAGNLGGLGITIHIDEAWCPLC